jgi:hypothetical protein
MDEEAPGCICFPGEEIAPDVGPVYVHLGFASTLVDLKTMMQERCDCTEQQIRMVEAQFLDEEDRVLTGCPIGRCQ